MITNKTGCVGMNEKRIGGIKMSKQNRYIWHDGDIYLVTEETTNIEEQQAEMDALSMSHDNLQRELSDIKRLMGKDKHALIKSNIALNERVQELEKENKRIRQMNYHEAYEQGKFDTNMKVWYEIPKLEQQNKRYREALEKIARINIEQGTVTVSEVHAVLTARKALEESK